MDSFVSVYGNLQTNFGGTQDSSHLRKLSSFYYRKGFDQRELKFFRVTQTKCCNTLDFFIKKISRLTFDEAKSCSRWFKEFFYKFWRDTVEGNFWKIDDISARFGLSSLDLWKSVSHNHSESGQYNSIFEVLFSCYDFSFSVVIVGKSLDF